MRETKNKIRIIFKNNHISLSIFPLQTYFFFFKIIRQALKLESDVILGFVGGFGQNVGGVFVPNIRLPLGEYCKGRF